jgi:hypothetical protein
MERWRLDRPCSLPTVQLRVSWRIVERTAGDIWLHMILRSGGSALETPIFSENRPPVLRLTGRVLACFWPGLALGEELVSH